MTTEAIKALNRIAHFEAVQIIQDAARRAGRHHTHVQAQIGAAFTYWEDAISDDDNVFGICQHVKAALANLGLPILRDA